MLSYRMQVVERLMALDCPAVVRTHASSAATTYGKQALKASPYFVEKPNYAERRKLQGQGCST